MQKMEYTEFENFYLPKEAVLLGLPHFVKSELTFPKDKLGLDHIIHFPYCIFRSLSCHNFFNI